jgi:hypothetical protein
MAVAAGQSTLTTGTIVNTAYHQAGALIDQGSATFTAAAQTTGSAKPSAAADTFVAANGFDLLIEITTNSSQSTGHTAVATSTTKVIAIDFPNWDPAGGPIVIHQTINTPFDLGGWSPAPHHVSLNSLHGNFADASAQAIAHGPNTFTSTTTDALTITNAFSAVDGLAVTAIA